jgi:hypothetical protein
LLEVHEGDCNAKRRMEGEEIYLDEPARKLRRKAWLCRVTKLALADWLS